MMSIESPPTLLERKGERENKENPPSLHAFAKAMAVKKASAGKGDC